ncbi:hypothetical protein KP001_11965 [Geomonas subterranea]|uniref:Uncharacterized protein n=1 Tax=Geomonas subterranea TaxID=2847989 RepID=A0ABX8LG28_9BACT|nr:hypothetical protein [Geomonas subterranea]QXE89183.1 hypothetical protein KP001_11965 [Geomonas subterranea]QXM08702.1 hypothetical protein KP002_17310 [Geomonas subterranea]
MDNVQNQEVTPPREYVAIRQRKTETLLEYLRGIQELNLQLKMFEISEEILRIDREHDRALDALFLREGK